MYTTKNFKTKKQLVEQVAQWLFFVDSITILREANIRFRKNGHEPLECAPNVEGLKEQDWEYFSDWATKRNLNNPQVRLWASFAVGIYQPNDITNSTVISLGETSVEGPHYPEPHKWYARVRLVDGIVVEVK